MIKNLFSILIFFFSLSVYSQVVENNDVEYNLNEIAKTKKGLNQKIKIDISGLTLYDFITLIAEEHKLNVSVDSNLDQMVNSNFFDVEVKDIFVFLIDKYDLEVTFFNSIISFNKKKEVVKEEPKKVLKEIDINYNSQNNFLSVKLRNDSLPRVAQRITEIANKNIVLAPNVKDFKVSAYIINRPFDQVLEMMAKSNQLKVTIDENGFYFLEKDIEIKTKETNKKRNGRNNNSTTLQNTGELIMSVNPNGYLNVKANESQLINIIIQAAELLNINYFLLDRPSDETTTLMANDIAFEEILNYIFQGKKYTFKKENDIFIIGEKNTESLRATELIQLENRTIEVVVQTLPKALLENIEVHEVIELNGLIVSGSKRNIIELKEYIREIDKIVPLIQIEVLIVQYNKSYDIQTGLKAVLGIEGQDIATSGTIYPATNITLNSASINDLINSFTGLGIFNLGKVTENFYANLIALENNSIINIKSTPKIATLNGHEASVSIGETSYYFEQTNRLVTTGGVNENLLQSGVWKSTEANLVVRIKPYVSKNGQVTLDISVEKSAFLGRAGESAPPDKATQFFESLVRVKNNEMILLGGLDKIEKENTSTGTPFLSRIPIISWFFSDKKKSKSKSKLHIFIKPTIIY